MVGAPIVAGLVPCNVIADEILTDHPARYRAMIVEAANPAHSVADSPRFREALRALDTLVVIDVAMTETARLAHYVLPAATQFEKAEATFFNFEFPRNAFHLRPRLLPPPEGALPEAEIHARLCLALGAVTEEDLAPLRAAAAEGKAAYAQAVVERFLGDPRLAGAGAGAPLPDHGRSRRTSARARCSSALALRAAMQSPASLARAGFGGSPIEAAQGLFDAILVEPGRGRLLGGRVGGGAWGASPRPTAGSTSPSPTSSRSWPGSATRPLPVRDPAFPFVLSAGERRSFTANTIIRDPAWRKTDAAGALRITPADAAALGVGTGDRVRIIHAHADRAWPRSRCRTRCSPATSRCPTASGSPARGGAGGRRASPPTSSPPAQDRDPFVGTPWHKHVPARVERA